MKYRFLPKIVVTSSLIFLLSPIVGAMEKEIPSADSIKSAIYDNDPTAIDRILKKAGGDINARDSSGETPLTYATRCHIADMLALLLEKDANPNTPNDAGMTPLMIAVESKWNADAVKRLLIFGADKNFKNADGRTALMEAVNGENLDVVKVLLERGADINIRDNHGWTALLHAVRCSRDVALVKWLLAFGADPNIKDNKGTTPLMLAILEPQIHTAATLLAGGALVNLQDEAGWTALMYATARGFCPSIELLLCVNADPSITNKEGNRALDLAIASGDSAKVALFVKRTAFGQTTGSDTSERAIIKQQSPVPSGSLSGSFQNVVHINPSMGRMQDQPYHPHNFTVGIKMNDLAEVEKYLNEGGNINIRDYTGDTMLTFAVSHCFTPMVKFLLKQGANPNLKDNLGMTPLTRTVRFGNDCELARILLENNADPNIKTNDGMTALGYATLRKTSEMAALLLEKGANINIQDHDGMTPLMRALLANANLDTIRLLLYAGTDLNVKNTHNITVLDMASICPTIGVAEVFSEYLSNLEAKDNAALVKPMDIEQQRSPQENTQLQNADYMMASIILKQEQQQPMQSDADKLIEYVTHDDFENIAFFLQIEGDINAQNEDGDTALMCAARKALPDMVTFLLANGAKTDIQNSSGWTALMYAACYNKSPDFKIVELLLAAGANPNLKDTSDKTAADMTTDPRLKNLLNGQKVNTPTIKEVQHVVAKTVIQETAQQGPSVDTLVTAINAHDHYGIRRYLNEGGSINGRTADNKTALMIAVNQAKPPLSIIKFLLEMGADPNLCDAQGMTPLMLATIFGQSFEVIGLLLIYGARPNTQDNDGSTALMNAAAWKNPHWGIVQLLLMHGADPNIQNKKKMTALMIASSGGARDIVQLLLNSGANPHLKDLGGCTAFDLAKDPAIKMLFPGG